MMRKNLVSLLLISLLLVVNTTAISENVQTTNKSKERNNFAEERISLNRGILEKAEKFSPIFKVKSRSDIHLAKWRTHFLERGYRLSGEISFFKKSSYSIKDGKPPKGKTIYVPDDYSTIQKAVNHAQPGDTIIVRDGTYVENIVINKPYLTIKSENGPENCIVKAESDDDPVFLIYGNYTTLTGFTIIDGEVGIELDDSSNNIITNNIISNNECDGIWLGGSSNNIIMHSTISNNECYGIGLCDSSNNIITNNTISNNEWDGIWLWGSSNNQITNNTFIKDGISVSYSYQNTIEGNTVNGKPLVYLEGETNVEIEDAGQVILVNCSNIEVKNLKLSNTDVGIELWNSKNCRIESNVISKNDDGIELWYSSNNIITNNTISNNEWNGIELDDSSNNIIANNSISNNKWYGIELWDSSRNTITNNIISNNGWIGMIGIRLDDSSNGNIIFLNSFVNNRMCNAWDEGKNYWDNGTIGNYWDDYFGRDTDGDGIGDTPYPIPPYYTLNFDYYPIVKGATQNETDPPEVIIDKPRKGYLYILNHEFWPTLSGKTVIIGDIDIKVTVRDTESGIYSVLFYIDGEKKRVEYASNQTYMKQYTYRWDETAFGKHTIRVAAYDRAFNVNITERTVFIINVHPHLP